MAISDGNESLGAADLLSLGTNPVASAMRKRHATALAESPTISSSEDKAHESEDLLHRSKPSSGCDSDSGCGGEATADSANSAVNEKKDDDEKVGNSRKETLALKYAYRASSPAHRRVKESPLSSGNIFKQVREFGVYVVLCEVLDVFGIVKLSSYVTVSGKTERRLALLAFTI